MNTKEKNGYILFGISCLIGYVCPVIFAIIYASTEDTTWLYRSGVFYGLSWILYGLFFIMFGKSALIKIKYLIKTKIFKLNSPN